MPLVIIVAILLKRVRWLIEEFIRYKTNDMNRDNRLLTTKSFESMLDQQSSLTVENMHINAQGVFWMMDKNDYGIPYLMTGFNGGDDNIASMMWFDPNTKMGYIFIGNTGQT